MALVRLTNTASIAVDAPAARSWALLIPGQQLPAATITLPYGSPAAAPAYLNANGGSLVSIGDENGSGTWRGIVTGLDFEDAGLTINAAALPVVLTTLVTGYGRAFQGVPAGTIVRWLLKGVLSGSRVPLSLGTVAETGPLIQSFAWHFDYAWDILSQLMQTSGQELTYASGSGISPDTLSWGPAVATPYRAPLVADVSFLEWKRSTSLIERAGRVIVSNGSSWVTSTKLGSDTNHWPTTAVVKDSSLNNRQLKARATSELTTRGRPVVTLTGSVGPANFDLREGNTVDVLSGGGAFGTSADRCRVLARALRPDGDRMDLTFQVIDSSTSVAQLARSVALAAKQTEMAARIGRTPYSK